MTFDEFLGQVQNRARLASTGEALKATRATLTVLSQRLFGGEADELAAQLPSEIKLYLEQVESPGNFGLDEFLRRVAEIEEVDLPEAIFHARAVMSVLLDAVSAGEIRDMRAQLPDEYAPLFQWERPEQTREAA